MALLAFVTKDSEDAVVKSLSKRSLGLGLLVAMVIAAGCDSGGGGSGTGGNSAGGGRGGAGTTGNAGTTGGAGTTGNAGTTGGAGTTGAAGTSGNAGTTGGAGTTGAAGTSGIAGTTGGAGTTGAAGTSGNAGTTGNAGRGGSGGVTGSGGSAGTTGGGGRGGGGGTGGVFALAAAALMPFGNGTIAGTATFTNVQNGVQVVIALRNCPAGVHGIHIHQGSSCTSESSQGMHWGGAGGPGEGIGSGTGLITCASDNTANLTYVRQNGDSTSWSIGPPGGNSVVNHAMVVHEIDPGAARHACGVIQMAVAAN